jgi:hypothetical protein
MSSDAFARIAARHESRKETVGELEGYLAARGTADAVRPNVAADFIDCAPEEVEGLLEELAEEQVLVRRHEWICPTCDAPIMGDLETDETKFCDDCTRYYRVQQVRIEPCYFLRAQLVQRPRTEADGDEVFMGQNPLKEADRLRHARVTPWKALAEDDFTLPIDALEGGDKGAALRMLHEHGIVRIRMYGDTPSAQRLLSLENWVGPAREVQNDTPGKVKSLVPNYDAPPNTGDSSQALAPHVDGTQDDQTPALLAFQYQTGGKWGAESTFLDTAAMLAELPEHDLARILTVLARKGCGTCTKTKGEWSKTFTGPIVQSQYGGLSVSIRLRDDDLLSVIDECAREFNELRNLVRTWSEHNMTRYTPQDGDIVIFDNWRLLHGRAAVGGSRQRIHDRMWIDCFLPVHDGKYMLGVRPLGNGLLNAIELANAG